MPSLDSPHTSPPTHPSHAPAGEAPVRLAQVDGDRACHACGFNLRGQTVVREPHYHMIMVQCPECGAPSPLLDYPRLGPWPARLKVFTLIFLIALLITGFIFTGFLAWRYSYEAMSATATPLAELIGNDYVEYAKPRAASGGVNAWWGQQAPSAQTVVELPWWQQNKASPWAQRLPTLFDPLSARAFGNWLNECLALTPLCAAMACALPHWSRRRLLLVPLVALFVTFTLAWYWTTHSAPVVTYLDATSAALQLAPWWVLALSLAVSAVIMLVGVLLGRPAGRVLVKFLVPPRQWASFGFLWIADGLALPRPHPTKSPQI